MINVRPDPAVCFLLLSVSVYNPTDSDLLCLYRSSRSEQNPSEGELVFIRYTRLHVLVFIYIYILLSVYMCVCLYIYIYTSVCLHVRVFIYIYTSVCQRAALTRDSYRR